MEAIEVIGKIDEQGKLIVDELLPVHNKQVRVVLLIEEDEQERKDWIKLSMEGLSRAYGPDEPEYTVDMVKEVNPKYNPHG
ncbi:MAG: hypothetical protein EPN39_02630 [Chitinophagaceae bacterium]|nr:MAG: hypothetical protein EPN39_02630 [Chitinophagaceae bacterium]